MAGLVGDTLEVYMAGRARRESQDQDLCLVDSDVLVASGENGIENFVYDLGGAGSRGFCA